MHRRLPVSTRHAFALAFDLAVRRDWLHSLVVPLLLQSPWFVALALLPPLEEARSKLLEFTVLIALVLIGQTYTVLLVSGMLRFRARSVFNTPPGDSPAPVLECYREAVGRVPSLFVTEAVRHFAHWVAGLFLVIPALYVGFKFSMATEAVVLGRSPKRLAPGEAHQPEHRGWLGHAADALVHHPLAALRRSFRDTEGRFERWLEMIVISVVLVLSLWFIAALLYVGAPGPGPDPYGKAALIAAFAILPVIQYAWTFFYLRLEESVEAERESNRVLAGPVGGWHAGSGPQLRLIELERPETEDEPGK